MTTTLALANPDAEADVLGALILDPPALAQVRPLLPGPDAFTTPARAQVYAAILALVDAGKPIDPTTLRTQLHRDGVAGDFLADLADRVPGGGNAPHHAALVADCYRRRRADHAATALRQKLTDPGISCDAAVAETIQQLAAGSGATAATAATIRPAVTDAMLGYEAGAAAPGLSSGLPRLDDLTGGWRPGRLTCLAAGTSEGKTALALAFAREAAGLEAAPLVLYFTREMGERELVDRLISSEWGVNVSRFQHGKPTDREITEIARACGALARCNLAIDEQADTPALMRLAVQCRQTREPVGLVIVDYLQLLRADAKAQNRDREIGEMTASLKRLARQLQVPVILLSQLSREHKKQGRKPELYDLRDSGNVEQDCDQVLMLHTADWPERGPRAVDLYVRKNRGGPLGKVALTFEPWTFRWQDAERLAVA